MMRRYKISGVPVTKDRKLVGILTNRDLRFVSETNRSIDSVMTKENLITVPVGTTLEEAEHILHQHRVEKLLVVNDDYELKGLITVKDIQKKLKYPNACKDSQGRLRVAAAIGATGDYSGAGGGAGGEPRGCVGDRLCAWAFLTSVGGCGRGEEGVSAGVSAGGKYCDVRWGSGADGCGCGCDQGGDWAGVDLHDAHGDGCGHAADYGDL